MIARPIITNSHLLCDVKGYPFDIEHVSQNFGNFGIAGVSIKDGRIEISDPLTKKVISSHSLVGHTSLAFILSSQNFNGTIEVRGIRQDDDQWFITVLAETHEDIRPRLEHNYSSIKNMPTDTSLPSSSRIKRITGVQESS